MAMELDAPGAEVIVGSNIRGRNREDRAKTGCGDCESPQSRWAVLSCRTRPVARSVSSSAA